MKRISKGRVAFGLAMALGVAVIGIATGAAQQMLSEDTQAIKGEVGVVGFLAFSNWQAWYDVMSALSGGAKAAEYAADRMMLLHDTVSAQAYAKDARVLREHMEHIRAMEPPK